MRECRQGTGMEKEQMQRQRSRRRANQRRGEPSCVLLPDPGKVSLWNNEGRPSLIALLFRTTNFLITFPLSAAVFRNKLRKERDRAVLMHKVDTLILPKAGAVHLRLPLRSKFLGKQSKAQFFMSAVTSALVDTFRCHSSGDLSLTVATCQCPHKAHGLFHALR